ncbi:MAG TPA: hypothetical protein VG984_01660 [Candidatus Paceibacterota bacterium]|nr:hypothetical protein [Candidatus Paceibacterota bacterium]
MDDRKTLALIDGASLHKCAAQHGITQIDAAVLYTLLHTKTQSKRLLPPVITMLPHLADNPIGEAFRKKGFEVIPSGTLSEEDDHHLCRRIDAVDRSKVGRIVMVGADHRYLRPLWEQHKEGVSICWFIADSVNAKGFPSIGKTLRRFLTCGLFTWVDMKPFFPALRYVQS